jgi:hypothetical protein
MNIFQENSFQVLRNFIDPTAYHKNLREREGDGQSYHERGNTGYKTFGEDALFDKLIDDLLPVVESYSGCELLKTYYFCRSYSEGNILPVHTDRNACEISLTICLGYEKQPWPLWILDKDEHPQSIILMPGDALLYKGIEVPHWRSKNIYGSCLQVFLHYVNKNGPYAIHENDRISNKTFSMKLFNKVYKLSVQPNYKR